VEITAIKTALGQHVRQDLVYLTVENAGGVAKLTRHGIVRITIVNAVLVSFGLINSKAVRLVMIAVKIVKGLTSKTV
jgi:hypothetical protein